ncbi:LuxR C-terminal-related transcriptional regulator [Sphaerisporangium sp. NPDC005289]|uniref:LuxR C-terminal-related transcriptional regulator n=1 Tax=Sphaerisporangium sp. NPDC005289 TaxID=3155247 RepID=UPI0033BFA6C0
MIRELFADASGDEQMSAEIATIIDEFLGRSRPEVVTASSVRLMLLRGRTHEAERHLREFRDAGSFPELADWVRCWYPGLSGLVSAPPPAASFEVGTGLEGLSVLAAFFAGHDSAAAVARADQVLRACPMGEPGLESLVSALATLVYADRADLAARWCEPLLEQTTSHCDPYWQGAFAAIRAETAIRQGRVKDAERCARNAFSHLPMEAWGVALGTPLAAMTMAKTALGKLEDAARYLAVPVLDAMFQTPVGLHYLSARGTYRLAAGAAEDALADFLACGDLMRGWGIDLPGVVAWRLGAVRALLQLGRTGEARRLAEEQLAEGRSAGAEHTRTWGIALRLRALTLPLRERPEALEQAVETLQLVQDTLELAHALADAGWAYSQLEDGPRARAAERRSRQLLRSCGASPQERPVPPPSPGADLSEAERRVATLAARGQTNRQISGVLFVTVSTVEQHLTRIYRKLGVSRRADLPVFLD